MANLGWFTVIQAANRRLNPCAAEHLKKLAKELTSLSKRQLEAVSPVLEAEPELFEAISIAQGINPTNQVSPVCQLVHAQCHVMLH